MAILQSIGEAIVMGLSLIGNLLMGTAQLIQMIPQALSFLTYGIASMPPVMTVFATAFISVSIVYLILGR